MSDANDVDPAGSSSTIISAEEPTTSATAEQPIVASPAASSPRPCDVRTSTGVRTRTHTRYTALCRINEPCWLVKRLVLVMRPGGLDSKLVFRDEALRTIHTPDDFSAASVVYLTNDHEATEIEGDTIFDREISILSAPRIAANGIQLNYEHGGPVILRDVGSMLVWSDSSDFKFTSVTSAEIL